MLYSSVCFVLMIKCSKKILAALVALFLLKMLSSTCNELTIISYFGTCEYDCFNILEEHGNNILKEH